MKVGSCYTKRFLMILRKALLLRKPMMQYNMRELRSKDDH